MIVGIAKDPAQFRFLQRCQPNAPMVVGDARLTLGREPANSADVLVIDAFSSDSVPMHLLTREAFAGYRRHLRPDGLLMVHISNRYLDLTPVIGAATEWGWTARTRLYLPTAAEKTRQCRGVIVGRAVARSGDDRGARAHQRAGPVAAAARNAGLYRLDRRPFDDPAADPLVAL